jgi:ABC-2 type transport system ATP-binding protein
MQPAIDIRDLVKTYGGRNAVDGLSLQIQPGIVCALLGANGAGKTTTIECLEGFRAPDSGSVRVLGLDPRRDRADVMPQLGVMLQEGGAYQAASPREMLGTFARFYPDAHDPDALLERLGLSGSARVRHRNLSGGQKQRLNLALALVGRPRVALLDEPTVGMDPQARRATWELIRELRDDGVTVLLTTHLMDEAERLADLVAVVDRGRLLALDTPRALLAAHRQDHLELTTDAQFDAGELSAAMGAPVWGEAEGRWHVAVGPEAMAAVTAWFAERGLVLRGVTTGGGGLEEVFLRITDEARSS